MDSETAGDEKHGNKHREEADSEPDWLATAMFEDWELEDELNEAEQLAASLGAGTAKTSVTRIDAAHLPRETRDAASIPPPSKKSKRPKFARTSLASWCMLSLGLMAFVFGAVLLGWSFVEDRPELWRLGMPFTLGGQATLIVGLVFQLDALWRNNHEAVKALDELDVQLDELRRATSLLSTTHSSSAQSFYLHMADGASPHLLLADLKGQLDLLATRIGNRH